MALELRTGGLFTTDLLLGVDRLPLDHRRAYEEYFLRVIRQRGFPLDTAALWNALNFGWSLELGSYLGRDFEVSPVETGRPLPVGSFVEVPISARQSVWAEVVYKEGWDERVRADGVVAPAASGARLGLRRAERDALVGELLVLDYEAFGGLNDAGEDDYARAERRGRLTSDRHKVVKVCYPAEDAGLDDLALFARHIYAKHGDRLFGEFLRDQGATIGREERLRLLHTSLAAVHELASAAPGIRTFGAYHLDGAAYSARRREDGDALFGGAAIDAIVASATMPPSAPRQTRFGGWSADGYASYRSVGALVREYLGRHSRAETEALTADERALLEGPGYSRLVLETNLAIVDRVGADGMVGDTHVRLDDEWQGGGVWRTCHVDGPRPPESMFGPLVALGLGYAETESAGRPTAPEPATRPDAEASDVGRHVTLKLIDLHHRDLPLDATIAVLIPAADTSVIVDFTAGDAKWRRLRPFDRERRLIREMLYPASLVPGTILACSAMPNGKLITVKATPLSVPLEIGGQTVRFEYNDAVLRREIGLLPIERRYLSRARTLTDQINEVFRRRGRPLDDGGRALRVEEVVGALLGPETTPAMTFAIAMRLQTGDFEFRSGEYVWFPQISRRTSPRERVRILAARERDAGEIERVLAPRMVPMGIRTYREASGRHGRKHASYADARRRYGAENRTSAALGPLQTWVEPYPLEPRKVTEQLVSIWDD
jgi:hypothetical protein